MQPAQNPSRPQAAAPRDRGAAAQSVGGTGGDGGSRRS